MEGHQIFNLEMTSIGMAMACVFTSSEGCTKQKYYRSHSSVCKSRMYVEKQKGEVEFPKVPNNKLKASVFQQES